jgi:hypothetical protein
MSLLAHRVTSRQRGKRSLSGAKRTSTAAMSEGGWGPVLVRGCGRPFPCLPGRSRGCGGQASALQAIADCATNAQMSGGTRHRMRDGKQRQAQHRAFLFPAICFHVCTYHLRGGGATWSRTTSLFCVIASLFSRSKFPVQLLRETRPKRPEYRGNQAIQTLRRPEFRKFPCIFPC